VCFGGFYRRVSIRNYYYNYVWDQTSNVTIRKTRLGFEPGSIICETRELTTTPTHVSYKHYPLLGVFEVHRLDSTSTMYYKCPIHIIDNVKLYYLILWHQVDILLKTLQKGSCPYTPKSGQDFKVIILYICHR